MVIVIVLLKDPWWLLVATPLVGAALGLLLWSKPRMLKRWALLITLASLSVVLGLSGRPTGSLEGLPMLVLLPLTAFLSLLGQPARQEAQATWLLTLILLGLGLGVLAGPTGLGVGLLLSLLGLLTLLIARAEKAPASRFWWSIGTYGLGVAGLSVSLLTTPPISQLALLVTFSVLLPLFPLHGGYVGALTLLPGNLPAFLALLLPSIGFHGLLTLIPNMPEGILRTLIILALFGALYGSLKALVQGRVSGLLVYASMAFFSILWWYLATIRAYTPQAEVYLSSVALVTSGLFLAWHSVQARYGELDQRRISGLARPMPRLAILLTLLVMAAMGLPPFGLFSGFMGMLLHPSLTLSGALVIIVLTWLVASWYFLTLMQQLLFGPSRSDARYEDLRPAEIVPLLVIVSILVTLGIAPSRLFESTMPPPGSGPAMESALWSK